MGKALLKKQFLELNSFYFQNKKTGKRRSKGGLIGYAVLYIALFGFLGAAFFAMGSVLATAMVSLELDWLYFALMGLLAILLGVFGDVFNTYAGLYQAKDNDLLLSMPVPPGKILLVRLTGVYAMGLLYEALVFVPAAIAYWVAAKVTMWSVIGPVLLVFILAVFVMTLSCALGWVVALISARLKNKSIVTALLSLAFLALYYVVYFRISSSLEEFLLHAESVGEKMKTAAYPFYLMGRGAAGHVPSLLLFTVMVAALLGVAYYILQRSFLKIVTMKTGGKKAVYQEEKAIKTSSVDGALLRKELRRFLSSPTYMLNGGLGLVIMLVVAVVCLIRMNWIHSNLDPLMELMGDYAALLPVAAALAVGLMACMNAISAPSVSLEGKNIWLPQSLPVMPQEVLSAKYRFALYMNLGPSVLCTVVLGLVVRADVGAIGYMVLFIVVLVMLLAQAGVVLNLRHPNLTWTSEVVPIKQGTSVAIVMFGGWALMMAIGAGAYFSRNLIASDTYLLAVTIVLALCNRLLNSWLRTKGAEIFASL